MRQTIRRLNPTFSVLLILVLFACAGGRPEGTIPQAIITVPQGEITIQFFEDDAPKHCANFISLASEGFFDGTTFHRIEPGFVIQGGDLKSKDSPIYDDGTGTLDYTLRSEFKRLHFRGAVAMAKKPAAYNPDNQSSACQFYIALDSLPDLDRDQHTVFARVISGFEVLDAMTRLDYHQGTNPNSNWKKVTEMTVRIEYVKP